MTHTQSLQRIAITQQQQHSVRASKSRIRVVNADRRWGKTTLALKEALYVAVLGEVCIYIVPNVAMLNVVKYKFLAEHGGRGHHPGGSLAHQVLVEGGGRIIFSTAGHYEQSKGHLLALTIFDEVDMMLPYWGTYISRPGAMLALGTEIPKFMIPKEAQVFDFMRQA